MSKEQFQKAVQLTEHNNPRAGGQMTKTGAQMTGQA